MKKQVLTLALAVSGIFCFSCNNTKNYTEQVYIPETVEEVIRESEEQVEQQENETPAWKTNLFNFLVKYDGCLNNYKKLENKVSYYIPSISGTINDIEATTINLVMKSKIVYSIIDCAESLSAEMFNAGFDTDAILAYTESFVLRYYTTEGCYLFPKTQYMINEEAVDDTYISFCGYLENQEEPSTKISFNRNGFLTEYKSAAVNDYNLKISYSKKN